MADFTITAVEDGYREWAGEHGTFRIFDVRFEGQQGNGEAEIKRKSSSPAPTVGEVVDAEIVQKAGRKPELKRVYKPPGGSGPRGNGGGNWRPRSPEETRAINRAVAQKNAIGLLGVELQAGLVAGDAIKASDLLKPRIDWLFDDLQKASES